MSKKKSKRRADVKSSILVLLLIAILLIASTYAWFTANKTVTISTLDVNVQAANGLQISADGSNWKAILKNTDIDPTTVSTTYAGNTNQIPVEMQPVSTAGVVDTKTGFMNMYYGTVASDETANGFALTTTKETDTKGTTGKYIAFDIFLRADKDTTLTLTDKSGVTPKDGSDDLGLQNSARVAFIKEGHTADTSAQASTVQALTGDFTKYIWEPNYDVHTTNGVTNALNTYGITTSVGPGAAAVTYYGVKDIITTPIALAKTYGSTADAAYFTQMTPDYKTPATMTNTAIFSLEKGITKMRIYMWVEGQDVDCENSASGTNISFDVQFTANDL